MAAQSKSCGIHEEAKASSEWLLRAKAAGFTRKRKPRKRNRLRAAAQCDRVLFVERSGELRLPAWISDEVTDPKGDQVRNGRRSVAVNPKPGDLPTSRLKLP